MDRSDLGGFLIFAGLVIGALILSSAHVCECEGVEAEIRRMEPELFVLMDDVQDLAAEIDAVREWLQLLCHGVAEDQGMWAPGCDEIACWVLMLLAIVVWLVRVEGEDAREILRSAGMRDDGSH